MIWKCLEKGDRAFAVFAEPYPYLGDYRVQFLLQYPQFKVIKLAGLNSSRSSVRVLGRIIWNSSTLRFLLRRYKIAACFMEWGPGIPSPNGNNGLFHEIRALSQSRDSVGRGRALRQLLDRVFEPVRIALISASHRLALPVWALPHGINTKLRVDHNPKIRAAMSQNGGKLLREDRNCFTVWVFSTEFERQLAIEHTGMRPSVAQTWGSLRFCPEWMQIVEKICPKDTSRSRDKGQIRLIFFLPKWHNFVDKQETLHLLRTLSERDEIQLILKPHPRKGTSELEEDVLKKLLLKPNVSLNVESHSPGLIRDADVVIDIGSGMSIETILRRTHLIYPAYLHQNRLIFDDFAGCLIAHSLEEVQDFLDKIIHGRQPPPAEDEVRPLINQLLYGGRKAFNVPEYYYSKVQHYLITHAFSQSNRGKPLRQMTHRGVS